MILRKFIAALLCSLVAAWPLSEPAYAQGGSSPTYSVVSSCGTLPAGTTYAVGQARPGTLDPNGNGCISGSISASLSGFTPNGNVANLSVSTSSANVALPSGAVVAVLNSGATDASIKLSVGAGSAATTDFILKSGATVGLTVGTNTFINAITASSTTTLSVAGGAGLVSGYGGGGSGGGGGGAVTIADGADVTLGAKADAKSTATDTTPITAMQVLKQISASVQAPPSRAVTNVGTFAVQNNAATPAGTNLIGKVGIDQTTPGTTNAVQVNATTYSTTDKGGTITSGGTAQNAITSNGSRKAWCIQNDPAATEILSVRLNGTASATSGIILSAGAQACSQPGVLDTTAVSLFAATTGHRFFGFEGQ